MGRRPTYGAESAELDTPIRDKRSWLRREMARAVKRGERQNKVLAGMYRRFDFGFSYFATTERR